MKEELKDANGKVEKLKSDDRELREQHEAALFKSLGQKDDVEMQFSRAKFISDQLIKSLKDENKKFKEEVVKIKEEKDISENNLHLVKEEKILLEKQFKEEADNNLKEIYKLNSANKEKDVMLENLTEENEKCNKNVDTIESELNTDKTDQNMNSFSEKSDPLNLNEELKMSAEQNEFFECNYCEKTFQNINAVRNHERECTQNKYSNQNVYKLEQMLLRQKFHMSQQIFAIRENEIHRRYSCNSSCKATCRIFHQKHDWFNSISEELLEKLNHIRSDSELENHIKTIHDGDQCESIFQGIIDFTAHEQTKPVTEYDKLDSSQKRAEEVKDEIEDDQSRIEKTFGVNFSDEEHFDCNLKHPFKHFCRDCFLYFEVEDELRHRMSKHIENARLPSILKNL